MLVNTYLNKKFITMSQYIIQTEQLSYQYSKQRKVLDGVSLNIPKGSIYGFLGPNGAGKSTTMRLITGIIPEQQNAIKLFGKPLKTQFPQVFTKIGALVESPALYLHLSAYDNLRYIAKVRGIAESKIDEVLALVDLLRDKKRKAKQYSLGMKQRLAIAMALLGDPELLLLDEPVNGLDPNGILDIRNLLVKINKERGVTIFVSSHLLAEIEKMCTHVGIISHGKLRFEGTIDELSKSAQGCKMQLTFKQDAELWLEKLKDKFNEVKQVTAQQLTVQLANREEIPAFINQLSMNGALLYEVKIVEGLEEWFMNLTNIKN
ncbi:MAG: ABC transporter ATP-binding protein [Pedobacter sp.]|nr:ABC transporter ATP-binding protein [Pedobacter sp.]